MWILVKFGSVILVVLMVLGLTTARKEKEEQVLDIDTKDDILSPSTDPRLSRNLIAAPDFCLPGEMKDRKKKCRRIVNDGKSTVSAS